MQDLIPGTLDHNTEHASMTIEANDLSLGGIFNIPQKFLRVFNAKIL